MIRQDDYAIIRSNERAKLFSGILANLGTALAAAAAYRVVMEARADVWSGLWTLGAGALIWAAYMVLALLEPES